ncbi:MAG: cytidylate kinase [Candidatus Altiarchaeales archaeon ex4484_96]|nr:MAG: cytidylate kinase [Candidatus Altiarchaeales archaeon ex4484_96]
MIVTVGGLVGAGKSTLGKGLAKKYGLDYISAGQVMRDLAKQKNMSLQQYSSIAEENPEIDRLIDEEQKKAAHDNCVVDGRLAAYFIEDADLRVWLTAPADVRATRIASRENITVTESGKRIRNREKSERIRYKQIYDIKLDDLSIYDLVINTGVFHEKATRDIVSKALDYILD